MRKLLCILACSIIIIFLGGQLHALVQISSVNSQNSADPDDNDGVYRSGQMIEIIVEYTSTVQPVGTVEINSETAGYQFAEQALTKGDGSFLKYVWNTAGLKEADDYIVSVTLTENEVQQDSDESLIIKIDNTPPEISDVISHDRDDTTDNNGIYHAGQNIAIDIQVTDETRLESTIQIKSDAVSYDSGLELLTDLGGGLYRYLWTTTALNPAKDYAVTVTFLDQAGMGAQDSSLRMEIDNTEPKNGKVLINNGDVYTISRSVQLTLSADAATKMYVSGDIVDDVSTFEWIPYAEALVVSLAEGDGLKRVSVRFMDDASNQASPAEDTIILDEKPPVIASINSHDDADILDDDGIYHAGQLVTIIVETDGSDLVELEGVVQITSAIAGYDSGLQTLNIAGLGEYTYRWNTIGLLEASDYVVSINLKDPSNREVSDNSLIIIIDNTPPTGGKVSINDDETETDSRSVTLTLSASGEPREVFIEGDLIDDTNTFEWVRTYGNTPLQVVVNLTDTDGEKVVIVKFRDPARNVSGITTATIILDRQTPTSASITIEDEAKYTTTRNVTLKLSAVNAEKMLIDGDVVDDPLTFDYIDYRENVDVELSPGDGEKRVGVVFINRVGIRSDRVEDDIILDTSEPVILSVESSDSDNPQDDDGVFHPGQSVIISVTTESGEVELDSIIRIRSQITAYDTGEQEMSGDSMGASFTYLWDTTALRDSDDYVVFVELTDAAGHKTENSDLKITIDSSPPTSGQAIINDGEETTESRTVRLHVTAVDAASIFMSGDLADDSNTFQWIPYRANLTVNLFGEDGEKTIYVKFRDAAGNESVEIQNSITLDRKSPYDLEMAIAATSEGAAAGESDEFATSQRVFLSLSAKNTVEMYIDGDVVKEDGTFEWTPYMPQTTVELTQGDGEKVIYAKFRNQRGIESEQTEASITLDMSPPDILSVTFQDAADPEDEDGWYHPGESVRIVIEAQEANKPEAEISIKSESTGYDSESVHIDMQTPIAGDSWRFEYVWNTADLDDGTDFIVEVTITDAAGWVAASDPAVLVLDSSPPTNAKLNINGGGKRTASRIVQLEMAADDAVEMFIAGDIRDDNNTSRWIPVKDSVTAVLISGDGIKNVEVKFRDMAENETDTLVATVILSQAPPVIEKVDSWDTSEPSDNDEIYHPGELIKIALKAEANAESPMIETGLLGTVFITSLDAGYDSGMHEALEENDGWYTYTWNTDKLSEGSYQVTWRLSDGVGHRVTDQSLSISIDKTPPSDPQISINDGAEQTRSRSVNLDLQATGSSWVLIDGDVLEDKGATFDWIPVGVGAYGNTPLRITVKLAGSDGVKRIQAKFKDDADNVTDFVSQSIILDTVGPDAVSAEINGGAEYTASTEIDLAIAATNAVEMYINGDAAAGQNVRQWIAYQKKVSLNLTEEDGEKTINVEFKDAVGNYSDATSDSIILDSTPPELESVKSFDTEKPEDDDDRYITGTLVVIEVDAGEAELSTTIQISSQDTGYASGSQKMEDAGAGIYTYLWNTGFLQAGEDYITVMEFEDKAGNATVDDSLIVAIFDKPIEQEITINDGEAVTTSQSVELTISADNTTEIYIAGDVVDDSSTYEWVGAYGNTPVLGAGTQHVVPVQLTRGDGVKNITVTFRDSLLREIGTSEASIELDQTPPAIVDVRTAQETYRADGTAEIVIQAGGQELGLEATIRIRSLSTGYDSGTQSADEGVAGEYRFLWDVTGLKEGDDYNVEAALSDKAEWMAKSYRLTIAIDSAPPEGGEITVNGGELFTQNRSVKLVFVAPDDAPEMLIEGDVIDDSSTFEWVTVAAFVGAYGNTPLLVVNLSAGDGEKKVQVRFRDEAGNESESIEEIIILNELPPVITAVNSEDADDPEDDDEIYRTGQQVSIIIEVDDRERTSSNVGNGESRLEAWVQIVSQESGYDSGLLTATLELASGFRVIWNTHSIQEASDYVVTATAQDGYGQQTVDDTLIITIDSTPPVVSNLLINGGKDTSNLQNVILTYTVDAEDATEMFIEGDVAESSDTFQWIQVADTKEIKLSEGNGEKSVAVKVRDLAGNVSQPASAAIILDRSIPQKASISINDGADYTESHKVTLTLSATSVREMGISGDVVQDETTFRWIPYEVQFSVRLTAGESEKTVRAVFRNGIGNESDEVEAKIVLDFSPPTITSVRVFDASDEMDDDLTFHSGQEIMLEIVADEINLEGSLSIKKLKSSDYDTGQQNITDAGDGHYIFLWNTEGVPDGDYLCEIALEDVAGHSAIETVEMVIDNKGPHDPSITIEPVASDQASVSGEFIYSRTIEVSMGAKGDPAEVFIAGDVVDDDRTFDWIPFTPDEDGAMKTTLNLRGIDGKKAVTVVFRDGARSESDVAEAGITLDLKRPELAGSCRIIQTDVEPYRAYLSLQFNEPISGTEPKSFFVSLRDKANPQNVVYLDGTVAELVLSNDVVMVEISAEQFDDIKQWQPMTLALSYIQAEIAENGVLDLTDKGNLSNERNPADVYFVAPALSIQVYMGPSSFSPNDDEVKDKITISYSPARTSDITIRIRNLQRETVKEWQVENQLGGLVYSVEWDGKKLDESPYPDGGYTVIVMGSEIEAIGFAYGLKLDLTIDNSAPQIVDVRPAEGAELPELLRASISAVDTPDMSGIEFVYMTIDGDIENKLPLAKSEVEGEYAVPVISELLLPPGKHDVSFHVIDKAGNETEKTVSYTVVTAVEAVLNVMNFPNPFALGGTTTIRYSLPQEARSGKVVIYDAGGDMVFFRDLELEDMEPGEHTFQWNGRDIFGNLLARGVYFCGIWVTTETEDESKIHKIAIR